MSTTKSHAWSTRYIDKYFGNQRNALSKYLRSQLLVCTDQFYKFNSSQNKCKEYRLNESGVRMLQENLNLAIHTTYPSVVDLIKTDHAAELTTGAFEYTDKSQRLWHPLQRYRKQYKQQILAIHGYTHQYDIECCAPTLIHQAAQLADMDLYLPAIRQYLDNRQQVRQELAHELELPQAAVKEIINALFAGAVVSKNPKSDISHIVNGDLARIEYLKQNLFVCELRANIKTCWEYLRPQMQKRTRITKSGSERLLPITSKQKWHLYFQLERQAMTCVRTHLDATNNKYFLEHDGWTCENPVDVDLLRIYVREQTGYDLRFEHEILQYTQHTLV
jgi:hypothetical protein